MTLAYLRLLQGSAVDARRDINNERDIGRAEGIEQAITLQNVLREFILEGDNEEEGDEEDDGNAE